MTIRVCIQDDLDLGWQYQVVQHNIARLRLELGLDISNNVNLTHLTASISTIMPAAYDTLANWASG